VDVEKCSIAIPGINTTANLLMSFTYPDAKNKIPMIFSSIEDAVLEGKTDLGVIIHENRFTYQQRGLKKVSDLGEYWENKMRVPIPLGGIAAKRKTDKLLIRQIDQLIRRSLEFAFENYPVITDYVRDHSQAMDETVMRQHIDLYVNDYSLSLGEDGKAAIRKLKEIYDSLNNIETATGKEVNLFVS
jgi:1,4-dihydroxy-6-naphthoate synthase